MGNNGCWKDKRLSLVKFVEITLERPSGPVCASASNIVWEINLRMDLENVRSALVSAAVFVVLDLGNHLENGILYAVQ